MTLERVRTHKGMDGVMGESIGGKPPMHKNESILARAMRDTGISVKQIPAEFGKAFRALLGSLFEVSPRDNEQDKGTTRFH